MNHPAAKDGLCHLIGNPINLSETPVSYRRPPPMVGEHTDEVLREMLNMDDEKLEKLRTDGVVG